jgi:hypothetical protein
MGTESNAHEKAERAERAEKDRLLEEAARQEYEAKRQAELDEVARLAEEQQRELEMAADKLKLQEMKMDALNKRIKQQSGSLTDMKERLRAAKDVSDKAVGRIRKLEDDVWARQSENKALQMAVSDSYRSSEGFHAKHLAERRSIGTQATCMTCIHDTEYERQQLITRNAELEEPAVDTKLPPFSKIEALASSLQFDHDLNGTTSLERPSSAPSKRRKNSRQKGVSFLVDYPQALGDQLDVTDGGQRFDSKEEEDLLRTLRSSRPLLLSASAGALSFGDALSGVRGRRGLNSLRRSTGDDAVLRALSGGGVL